MCCVASTAPTNSEMQVLRENGFSLLKLRVVDIFVEKHKEVKQRETLRANISAEICLQHGGRMFCSNRAHKCDMAIGWEFIVDGDQFI